MTSSCTQPGPERLDVLYGMRGRRGALSFLTYNQRMSMRSSMSRIFFFFFFKSEFVIPQRVQRSTEAVT